jgi:hypothetical protein
MFNLYNGTKLIGVTSLEVGTKVKLLDIRHEHAIILINGQQSPLPVLNTNIIVLMGGAEKILAYPDDPVIPSEGKAPAEKSPTDKSEPAKPAPQAITKK